MLIGVSGAGKTTLSRFVAWINGLSVFQIKVRGEKEVGWKGMEGRWDRGRELRGGGGVMMT